MARSKNTKGEACLNRRRFLGAAAAAGAAAAFAPHLVGGMGCSSDWEQDKETADPDSVRTNISTALAAPRTSYAMPGLYPGVVVEVGHPKATEGSKPNHADAGIASAMLAAGMKSLTGAGDDRDAWAQFFNKDDRIGIKINPTGLKLLSNTHELVRAIIVSLEAIGVPKSNIMIWDHFEHEMVEADYTEEHYPGIKCRGFSYLADEGGRKVWKGSDRMDEAVFYEFDILGEYGSEEQAAWMMNTGARSYFTRILTQEVDKVINVPVFKNYLEMITLCLKNMAYGVTSNCRRGHAIMNRYIAEVCAFPAVRDKTVLNIADGFRGCWNGGPVGVARFVWNANTIWIGTDPVAVDSVAWDFLFEKQVAVGAADPGDLERRKCEHDFLVRAENLGLGIFKSRPIDHRTTLLE